MSTPFLHIGGPLDGQWRAYPDFQTTVRCAKIEQGEIRHFEYKFNWFNTINNQYGMFVGEDLKDADVLKVLLEGYRKPVAAEKE